MCVQHGLATDAAETQRLLEAHPPQWARGAPGPFPAPAGLLWRMRGQWRQDAPPPIRAQLSAPLSPFLLTVACGSVELTLRIVALGLPENHPTPLNGGLAHPRAPRPQPPGGFLLGIMNVARLRWGDSE